MRVALWLPKYNVPLDDPCCYPLGFMYISSALKKAGYQVSVFNNNLWDYPIEVLNKYESVCLTGYEEFKEENQKLIGYCRDRGIHTVLGGGMATFGTQTADATVMGEGEGITNLAVKIKGLFNPAPPNLKLLPLPDYSGFGIDEYHRRHSHKYMGVLTSRGCPHNCIFCAHTCKYRCRNLEDVFSEIDLYKSKYNLEMIVVNDNTLNASRGRFERFCKGMLGRGLAWSAALRLDNLDERLVRLAKDSGLVYAVVGVESFQQAKLDAMNKRITVQRMEESLLLLEKYQVKYHGNVIFGFDGETNEQIQAEFDDMKQRPWRVFPVYLRKFTGVDANPSNHNSEFQEQFTKYTYERGMYCYP